MVSADSSVGVDSLHCGRHHQWRDGGGEEVQQHHGIVGGGDSCSAVNYWALFVCAALFHQMEKLARRREFGEVAIGEKSFVAKGAPSDDGRCGDAFRRRFAVENAGGAKAAAETSHSKMGRARASATALR